MIYLYGMVEGNAGPINVNRSLVKNSTGEITYPKARIKWLRAIESIYKTMVADAVVISSIWSGVNFVTKLALAFNKKVLYLKHGDVRYETDINHFDNMEHAISCEEYVMEHCNSIICVSETYMEWCKKCYPKLAHKMSFVNNGVDINFREKKAKRERSIAVTGGNRRIKNNDEVYKAIEYLNAHTKRKYTLFVYGRSYAKGFPFLNRDNVIYMGQLEKESYYNCLDEMQLMVVNSEVEPFGLVVADALNTNCSLLLSKNVGARAIVSMPKMDIIDDCHDVKEIARKIQRLVNCGNADILQKSVDICEVSEKNAAKNLVEICKVSI